ncbi:hypothetical protein GCM10027290_40230 [Micromonospora sonneratiae]
MAAAAVATPTVAIDTSCGGVVPIRSAGKHYRSREPQIDHQDGWIDREDRRRHQQHPRGGQAPPTEVDIGAAGNRWVTISLLALTVPSVKHVNPICDHVNPISDAKKRHRRWMSTLMTVPISRPLR